MIRLTRAGGGAAAMGALTLFAALASGNNLLYLVYGLLTAAFLVSWLWLRLSGRALAPRAEFPEALRMDGRFALRLRVANGGRWTARALEARRGPDAAPLGELPPGAEARAALDAQLPWRGLNEVEGLCLQSAQPFGLLRWSRPVAAEGLALPRPLEGTAEEEISALCESSGLERPRRGAGDELYGARPYQSGDEARLINWKLTLRAGKTFVNEFTEAAGAKVTVRADAGAGERAISAAAAALERCAVRGVQFRLAAGHDKTPFGTGRGHLTLCLDRLARLGAGGKARPAPAPAGARAEDLPASDPRLPALTLAGGLLLYAGLFIVDDIETPLLFACAPVFVWAWLVVRGRAPRLPDWFWTLASTGILLYTLLVDWRLSGVMIANTHLLLYMLANRLLASRTPADLRQAFIIHFLAFFLVSGQTISPWYFGFFFAYAAYAAAWLGLALSRGPGWTPRAALRPTAAVLGLSVVLFTATPRIEPLRQINPFVHLGLDKRKPAAEFAVRFTENVSLGFFGQLKRSSARVMRLKPLGGWGTRPGGPPAPFLLVRGAAFDRFDGRSWSKSAPAYAVRAGARAYRARDGRVPAARRGRALEFPGAAAGVGPGIEVTLYPLNTSVVFTAAGLTRLEGADSAAVFDHTDTVYFAAPYFTGTSYTAWGSRNPAAGFGPAILDYDRLLAGPYLALPALDARIAALAGRVTAGAATPREKARAVAAHLRRDYRYSLYSTDARRDLADFLFVSRSGNCEYFATAAAVLLRAAGVPTRLVAGFLADEWNEYGGFFDVRQGQAHAWIEAYVDGGWHPVDATPSVGLVQDRAERALGRLRRWATAAQLRWYRNVIGYDSFVQRDTLRRARLAVARDSLGRAADAAWPLVRGGILAALAGLVLLTLRDARRRGSQRRFAAVERLLKEAGYPRRLDQTARECAAVAAAARPELAPAAALVELHYRELYDPRGLDPAAEREADRLLKELRLRCQTLRS
ncbi:MAG: DUF3488 domain-containing protein [Elusimicrobia bacterium]|nr:DUF3488 domain-containing protein [Elusimicrobiota bacterium]